MGPCVSKTFEPPPSVVVVRDRKCHDDYRVGAKIGEGAQAVVYEARCKVTGARVAVKRTRASSFSNAKLDDALREVELLRLCHHPNVIEVRAAYRSSRDVCVVLEHCDGFHLVQYLVQLDKELDAGRPAREITDEKTSVLRQLVDAVAHVHSRGVVFRDLKLQNVMVSRASPRRVTLIDFGRAAHMTREDRRTQKTPPMGTSLFMAPEVESRDVYGQQSDMWALGVIVYFFVGGRMPFEHSVSGLYKVLMGQYEPFDKCFSDQAKDVVSRLLLVDPDSRLNAPQCAQHSFFSAKGASAAAAIAKKLPTRVRTSPATMRALETHESIVTGTARLLAETLNDEDLLTLQHWVEMSAETTFAEESAGSSRGRLEEESVRASRRSKSGAGAGGGGGGGSARSKDAAAPGSGSPLERLYIEMRDVGEASVKRGRLSLDGPEEAPVMASSAPESSAPAAAPPESSSSTSTRRGSEFLARGGLLATAHKHGYCSLDELIAACHSTGCVSLGEAIERVKVRRPVVSFRFVSFRFVSFRFVSFRFVVALRPRVAVVLLFSYPFFLFLSTRGGRGDATAKVLKDRRSPRGRGRMGTSV